MTSVPARAGENAAVEAARLALLTRLTEVGSGRPGLDLVDDFAAAVRAEERERIKADLLSRAITLYGDGQGLIRAVPMSALSAVFAAARLARDSLS